MKKEIILLPETLENEKIAGKTIFFDVEEDLAKRKTMTYYGWSVVGAKYGSKELQKVSLNRLWDNFKNRRAFEKKKLKGFYGYEELKSADIKEECFDSVTFIGIARALEHFSLSNYVDDINETLDLAKIGQAFFTYCGAYINGEIKRYIEDCNDVKHHYTSVLLYCKKRNINLYNDNASRTWMQIQRAFDEERLEKAKKKSKNKNLTLKDLPEKEKFALKTVQAAKDYFIERSNTVSYEQVDANKTVTFKNNDNDVIALVARVLNKKEIDFFEDTFLYKQKKSYLYKKYNLRVRSFETYKKYIIEKIATLSDNGIIDIDLRQYM